MSGQTASAPPPRAERATSSRSRKARPDTRQDDRDLVLVDVDRLLADLSPWRHLVSGPPPQRDWPAEAVKMLREVRTPAWELSELLDTPRSELSNLLRSASPRVERAAAPPPSFTTAGSAVRSPAVVVSEPRSGEVVAAA